MNQEQLQRKAAEIQWLKGQAGQLEQEITMVQRGLEELDSSRQALDAFGDVAAGSLFPLGSGIFAKAKLTESDRVLVDVGGRVIVDMPVTDAKAVLERRKTIIQKNADELRAAYEDTMRRLSTLNQEAEEMIRQNQS
ncbi:MAG: prefoldin subunit alpha [Candidatus Micrarchaeota archaeon]|nr:prefoldin subunit alpha [Candidatus Micrarchaeota archaeon]